MITVFGAGAIGCYVGGMLAAAGSDITFVGRPALRQRLANGLSVTAQGCQPRVVPTEKVLVVTLLSDAPPREAFLVCVNSGDTEDAARSIAEYAAASVPVISLQNGVTNPQVLASQLGADRVVPGMVGFNVVEAAPGDFQQTTEGEVITGPKGAFFVEALRGTDIAAQVHQNMDGIQWSKLLLNLNNSLNTLSGIGLKAQLEDRQWRRILAGCISEAIAVARAEGVRLERIGKVHPTVSPYLLRLPNALFLRIAAAMVAIDPSARSSMADDYARGRKSEIGVLNGYIVERAGAHGIAAPLNQRVTQHVEKAFSSTERNPLAVDPAEILQ